MVCRSVQLKPQMAQVVDCWPITRKFKISSETVNFSFSVAHSLRSYTLSIAGPIQEDMAPVGSRGGTPRTGGWPPEIFWIVECAKRNLAIKK